LIGSALRNTGTVDEEEAKRMLRVQRDRRRAADVAFPLDHLNRFFGGWRLVAIDQGVVRRYVHSPRPWPGEE
jgi:hypothetical protein